MAKTKTTPKVPAPKPFTKEQRERLVHDAMDALQAAFDKQKDAFCESGAWLALVQKERVALLPKGCSMARLLSAQNLFNEAKKKVQGYTSDLVESLENKAVEMAARQRPQANCFCKQNWKKQLTSRLERVILFYAGPVQYDAALKHLIAEGQKMVDAYLKDKPGTVYEAC